jgi:AraC-like DNA-binding protein
MDTLSHIVDDIRLTGAVFLRSELAAPWALKLHTPGLASFHIVVQGSAWLVRAGADPLKLDAGDLVILPGGADHRLQDTLDDGIDAHDLLPELDALRAESLRLGGPGEITRTLSGHFRFDVEMARPLVNALPPLIAIQTRGAIPPAWLRLGIQFIADEFSTRRLAQQAVTNRIADILLIEVLRHHLESLPEGAGNWLAALRDKGLSAALAAMHAEPGRGWTVPELAEIAHLSRSAFADRFSQVMGQPPLAYLTDHRMRLAAWKLAHSRSSIAQIAEQVGYASETAFSQAFKRHHGEPPSRMRGG